MGGMRVALWLTVLGTFSACAGDGAAGGAHDGGTVDAVALPCDPLAGDDPGTELWRSGTRLRATLNQPQPEAGSCSAPSLPALVNWYDRELGVDCQFATAEDAETRCLPVGRRGRARYTSVYYSTSDCTEGTGMVALPISESCSEMAFAYTGMQVPFCPATGYYSGWRVSALHEEVPFAGVPLYIRQFSGACAPASLGAGHTFCAAETVDPTTLVVASETVVPKGALSQRVLTTPDGAMALGPLFDPTSGVLLTVRETSLVPWGNRVADYGPYFSDPSCTVPVGCRDPSPLSPCELEPIAFVVGGPRTAEECDPTYYLPASTPSAFFGIRNGSCSQVDDPSLLECAIAGDVVPRPATETLSLGDGRLRPRWLGHAGEAILSLGAFYDAGLQTSCRALCGTDGRLRCLPGEDSVYVSGSETVFRSAACDEPLGFAPSTDRCSTMDRAYLLRLTDVATPPPEVGAPPCPNEYREEVLSRGARLDAAALADAWVYQEGACVPFVGLESDFYAYEAADPARFVPIDRATE